MEEETTNEVEEKQPSRRRLLEDALYEAGLITSLPETVSFETSMDCLNQEYGFGLMVTVLQKRPYTCVQFVEAGINCHTQLETLGFSKVMRGDEWDAQRGVEIATRRAARSMARTLEIQIFGEDEDDSE